MLFNSLSPGYQAQINPQFLQQMYAQANNRQDSAKSYTRTSDDEIESLLGQLSQMLNQAVNESDAEAAVTLITQQYAAPQPMAASEGSQELLQIELPAALKQLLFGQASIEELLSDPRSAAELRDQLRQTLAVQKALAEIQIQLKARQENPDESGLDPEALAHALEVIAQLEEIYDCKLARLTSKDWYMKWRMIYRDEMETKRNLRNRLREEAVSARSLPDGVTATAASSALDAKHPRPDLVHASDILQDLSFRADEPELSAERAHALLTRLADLYAQAGKVTA